MKRKHEQFEYKIAKEIINIFKFEIIKNTLV